jgi:hypothetical protein
MRKSKKIIIEQPNIVKDFYIGGTHIKIADNYYKDKTSEDAKKILNRIADIAMNAFQRQQQ